MIKLFIQYIISFLQRILNEKEKTLGVARSGHWSTFKKEHEKLVPKVCAGCGKSNVNIELHHIKPFREHPEDECKHNNVVWLCEDDSDACHFYLGHGKDFRGWNPYVIEDAALFLSRVESSKKLSKSENHYDRK